MPDFVWQIVKSALWVILPMGFSGIALVVAAMFVPAAAMVLEALIRFFSTKLGQTILAVIVAVSIAWTLFHAGETYRDEAWQAKWDAAEAKAKDDKAAYEQEMAAKNKLTAAMLQQDLDRKDGELQKKERDLELALTNSCRLGDNARRLRDLVPNGTAVSKPAIKGPRVLQWPGKKGAGSPVGR